MCCYFIGTWKFTEVFFPKWKAAPAQPEARICRNGKFLLFSFQYFPKKLFKRNDCGSDGEVIFYSFGEKSLCSSEFQYCLSYANRISRNGDWFESEKFSV